MSLDLANTLPGNFGAERKLKDRLEVRLIEAHERERFDSLMAQEHYLHNSTAVGAVLRYVVTEGDQWMALLTFNSPALHLKARDQHLRWKAAEVAARRQRRGRGPPYNGLRRCLPSHGPLATSCMVFLCHAFEQMSHWKYGFCARTASA